MKKRVSIILLNYNTSKDAIDCIKSLLNIKYKNYEIIVIDNKSRDDEYLILNEYIRDIGICSIYKSDENNGFAAGNNIGIKKAIKNGSDYILLLNCDTEVEVDFLDKLVDASEKYEEKIGVAISKIKYFNEKNKIWYAGGEIDWNNYVGKHYGEGEVDYNQYNEKKFISFATGCCMLINCKMSIDIELAEEYFMYYEDVDFSAKVSENGYKILYVPESVIYHKVGGSSGGEQSSFTIRWSNRGRFIFMNKYHHKLNKNMYSLVKYKFYCTRALKIICFILTGNFVNAKSIYYGMRDARKFCKK